MFRRQRRSTLFPYTTLFRSRRVYFAITCFDSQPELINHNLGRRDSPPFADSVEVLLDTLHDHRNAYAFGVTAGGRDRKSTRLNSSHPSSTYAVFYLKKTKNA